MLLLVGREFGFDACQPLVEFLLRNELLQVDVEVAGVGVDLDVMERDAGRMRSERPFVFTDLKRGAGVDRIVSFLQESGGL